MLKANIHQREINGLTTATLPAVIRDAIFVTRKFDIEYLWIDALCICQDDEAEWEEEVVAMADVYGGCVFAISALPSASTNEQFLKHRALCMLSIGSIELNSVPEKDDDNDSDALKLFLRERP